MARLSAGAALGPFVLERLIGIGGMSRVWAAKDERDGRAVALKLFQFDQEVPAWARERSMREARATRTIAHPAVVPVWELLEDEGAPVLVMELLEGETLRQQLEREGRLPLREAAAVLVPVAEALVVAHTHGIAHRDLKPENIFLQVGDPSDSRPRVRLLDFSVARFYAAPPGEFVPITAIDLLLGTPAYMAPEQALRPAEADQRVDVWAFGVTLYEALSGFRPIEGETRADTLRQLLVGGIVPLHELLPSLPNELSTLLARMLVRNPETRIQSLDPAAKLLRSLAAAG